MPINDLVGLGADALSNLYEVTFTPPGSALSTEAKLRTKDFTPPAPALGSYDIHWKTVSIKKPNAKITLDRSLTFTIRMDSNYDIYKNLLEWQKYQFDGATGKVDTDIATDTKVGTIKVIALKGATGMEVAGDNDAAFSAGPTWEFKNCWIEQITPSAYGTDSSDPVTVSVKFNYGDYDLAGL